MFGDPYEVAQGCDGVMVITEWNEFKQLDLARAGAGMKHKIMIDGRNIYDSERMAQLGFTYRGVGRGYCDPADQS